MFFQVVFSASNSPATLWPSGLVSVTVSSVPPFTSAVTGSAGEIGACSAAGMQVSSADAGGGVVVVGLRQSAPGTEQAVTDTRAGHTDQSAEQRGSPAD